MLFFLGVVGKTIVHTSDIEERGEDGTVIFPSENDSSYEQQIHPSVTNNKMIKTAHVNTQCKAGGYES